MNEERKKKLLRRVGKLLAQADGTTFAGEAQTAYTLAQKILLENGLQMEEVDALSAEQQKELVDNQEVTEIGHKHVWWLYSLAHVMIPEFRCKHYLAHKGWGKAQRHYLRIVGLAEDVAVCRDVFRSARETAERLATAYTRQREVVQRHLLDQDYAFYKWLAWEDITPGQKAGAVRVLKREFYEGFCEGLAAKFRAQRTANPSLAVMCVVHPVVQSAYDALGLRQTSDAYARQSQGNAAARQAGFEAGRTFEGRRPDRLASPHPRLASG